MKRFNVVALAIIGLLFLSVRVHASSSSLAGYYLLDLDADQYNTDIDGDGVVDLLANNSANGLRFKVDGGEELAIEFNESLLINKVVINHEDFVAALQSPLLNLIAQGKVPADTTLTVRPDMTKTIYLDDGSRSSDIPAIVLQTKSGSVLEAIGATWVDVEYCNVYLRPFSDLQPEELQISAVMHPDTGTSPLETNFTLTLESGTPPFIIFLDYGDGSMNSEFDIAFSLTTLNYSYTYSNPGSYIAQFSVMDANSEITQAVNIQVNDPATQNNIVLTDTSPSATITAGSDQKVYGTNGANSITLESGAKAELFNFAGNNTITIQADSSLFTVSRSGSTVTFEGTDGSVLKIPATQSIQTIIFNDISLEFVIDENKIILGSQEITTSSSSILTSSDHFSCSPKLVGLTSINSDSMTLEWVPCTDDTLLADKIEYHIHLSTAEGFTPSAVTKKTTVTGLDYATITGLTPSTQYYAMVVVIDSAGKEIWSNQLSAVTSTLAAVRTDKIVHIQDEASSPEVTPTTVTYASSDTDIPNVGDIITSTEGEGYLRKVTAITREDNKITATTEQASLTETYQDLEISTTIRMETPQTIEETQANASGDRSGSAKNVSALGTCSRTWPTGLTLSRSSGSSASPVRMKLSSSGPVSTRSNASASSLTSNGKYMYFSVPEYSSAMPGETMEIPIEFSQQQQIKFCTNRNFLGLCTEYDYVDPMVCKVEVTDWDHPDGDKEDVTPQPFIAGNNDDGYYIYWTPNNNHVDEKLRPYELDIKAWIGADGDNGCDDGTIETIRIKDIDIYAEQGEFEFTMEKNTAAFAEADFSLTNEVSIDFEPELDIEASIHNASLENAHVIARGTLSMTQVLNAVASAQASVTGELQVFKGSFIKIIPTAIPIMVRGELSVKLAAEATATAQLDFTETFNNTFSVEFGIQYDKTNGYEEVKGIQNDYSITISGEANGGLNAEISLIPEIKIHFYEAVSGHMILTPYLYADAGIEGHFLYLNENGTSKDDLDYSLTKFEAGGGVDLDLYAGFHIWDINIVSYPLDGEYENQATYAHFTPVDKTRFLGIPDLSAQVDESLWSELDSRSVLLFGDAQNIENPWYSSWGFGEQYILEFEEWTGAELVETASTCDVKFLPIDDEGQYWMVPLTPGQGTVRLVGHSTLGWFARQVIETDFDANDYDEDGMADYWELRFSLEDPYGDEDGDGNTNLMEYQNGTDPTVNDAIVETDGDNIPDLWEALYLLDPDDPSDAFLDPDNDGYTNLEEYRNGTDPTVDTAEDFNFDSLVFSGEIGCSYTDEAALFFKNLEANISKDDEDIYYINGQGEGNDYSGDYISFEITGEYNASTNIITIDIEMQSDGYVRTDHAEGQWINSIMFDLSCDNTYIDTSGCTMWFKMYLSDDEGTESRAIKSYKSMTIGSGQANLIEKNLQ